MSATALTAFLPFMASGSIFAPRRVNKGVTSNNAIVSIMDYDIAVGQGAKVVEGAANIAKESSNVSLAAKVAAKEKALEEFLKSEKALETAGKITRFTMNHINPLIGATESIKIIYAKDKEEEAITGGLAFCTMVAGETGAKNFFGLSKTTYKNGKYEITPREALYKKLPFYKEETEKAIKDFCTTTTFMNKHIFKHAPKIVKGIGFAAASIGSWTAGDAIGQAIYDNAKKNTKQTAKHIEMKPAAANAKNYIQAA